MGAETLKLTVAVPDRYTPLRLYASALPLIPVNESIPLPPWDPVVDSSSSAVSVVIPFDLRVPGWLPPSLVAPSVAVSYGVVAAAEIGWNDDPLWPADGPQTLLNPSPTTTRRVRSSYTPFIVHRHRMPTALRASAVAGERTFTLKPLSRLANNLECVVTVPEWADIHGDANTLRLHLRLRIQEQTLGETKGRCYKDQCSATLVELGMEVEEVQKLRCVYDTFYRIFWQLR